MPFAFLFHELDRIEPALSGSKSLFAQKDRAIIHFEAFSHGHASG